MQQALTVEWSHKGSGIDRVHIGQKSFGDDCLVRLLVIGNIISEGYNGIIIERGTCQVLDNDLSAPLDDAIEVTD